MPIISVSPDSGPDVDWLDALLVRMGAAPAPTLDVEGRVTRATTQAVKELQKWIGADPDGVFRPEYTVWARGPGLEGATTEVGSVSTAVGAQATPGTELFRTAARLEQARIQLDATPSRQALLREVPLSMTVDGTTVDVSGLELDSDDLHALEGMFDSTATDVDAVVLRRQVAFEPGAAPSSAVIPLGDGRGCLLVVSPDQTYEPRRFSLFRESSLEPGVTYVPSDLIGQTIVTNPSQELSTLCS